MSNSQSEIQNQLARVINSRQFQSSRRLPDLLNYLVETAIAGKTRKIKQYSIAVDVYGRSASFDPKSDPLIRIEVGRLRRALNSYYKEAGRDDPLLIEIPLGSYMPKFNPKAESLEQVNRATSSPRTSSDKCCKAVVAVFPFSNHCNTEDSYLINGLGEELTGELSRFSEIDVVAYNSTVHASQSSPDIIHNAKLLGADFIITGSVQNSGKTLWIKANLLDVNANMHIWRDKYNIEILPEQLFEIENEIVSKILSVTCDSYGAINRKLSSSIGSYRDSVSDPSVHKAILLFLDYQLTLSQESFQSCLSHLEAAQDIDPSSPICSAMYGQLLLDIEVFGLESIDDSTQRGIEFTKRAVSLDSQCQYAQHSMAYASMIKRDNQGLMHAATELARINPNSAFMLGCAGFWYCIAGEYEQGMYLFNKSIRLNPYYPSWFHAGPYFYYLSIGEYEKALDHAKQFNIPDFYWPPLIRAVALVKLGMHDAAEREYLEVLELNNHFVNNEEHFIKFFVMNDDLLSVMIDGIRELSMTRLKSESNHIAQTIV